MKLNYLPTITISYTYGDGYSVTYDATLKELRARVQTIYTLFATAKQDHSPADTVAVKERLAAELKAIRETISRMNKVADSMLRREA
jgi:predicted lipoprotein